MYVLVYEMSLQSIMDAVRFILAECGLVAMHGSTTHAYFVGVWFSGNVKFDIGKHIVSHTLELYIYIYIFIYMAGWIQTP